MEIVILILVVLLLLGLIFNYIQIRGLHKSYGHFFNKTSPRSIESLLKQYASEVKENSTKLDELATFTAKLHQTSSIAITKVGLIRFNPFGDTGGDQSFCLAAVDSYNNGFVLSSIHARTGTRVYAKEIIDGTSKYNLSDEEKQAVTIAIAKKATKPKR